MSSPLTLEDRLILACARTDANVQGVAELVELAPDWGAVVRKAERWGVVPLVDAHLRLSDRVPKDVAQRLRHLRQHETIHGLARFEMLRLVLTRFVDAAVPVIVLKGAALAALVYPSLGLRPMRDVDLLIHHRDHDRADAIVQGVKETLAASGTRSRNPYLRPDGLRALDIRWEFLNARGDVADLPLADFWARARPATIESVPTLVFSPEDLLLHLAFHLSRATRYVGQVKTLCDIGEVCRCYRDTLEWTPLIRRACAYNLGTELYAALRLALEMVWGRRAGTRLHGLDEPFGAAADRRRFRRRSASAAHGEATRG